MGDIILTQQEADELFLMEKVRCEDKRYTLPQQGIPKIIIPLKSRNNREDFSLDLLRGRIDLTRQTYQTRGRQVIVLVRLDLNRPHRNPDGEEIGIPHLHMYKEGYYDQWAYPLPEDKFLNLDNYWETVHDFMKYCNVIDFPYIDNDLFT